MKRSIEHTRRGAILVWVALAMILLLGFTALAVDVGHVYVVKADLQAAADAAALAGAEGLTVGDNEARARAIAYAAKNTANGSNVTLQASDVELGLWNPNNRTFSPVNSSSSVKPDAVRVTPKLTQGRGNPVSLFFARVFGQETADIGASATAFYRSRDIMLVLDYSGSMNDDSELHSIDTLGQAAVEANIAQIYAELGSPVYGNMQFDPVFQFGNEQTVVEALGLDTVPYPYPRGSWLDYADYVIHDSVISQAGYQRHYGYLTLINYWLHRQPGSTQTPGLWATSQQPLTAVKDAVDLFFAYLNQVETDDHVGLSAYTYEDGTAIVEEGLTGNFARVAQTARQRQAAHYASLTNIGAGIEKALIELEDNARVGAFKMIVLLTDGKANLPGNEQTGRNFARQQAQAAQNAGIPILTISLGANADTSLMGQIATITGGVHFNVPGGQSINAVEDDLNDIFRQIADHRPLKLVE